MLKKLLILSALSFSVYSQAEVLVSMIEKGASIQAVQAAINQGENVNEANQDGFTPLITAAVYSRPEVIKVLLQAGADVNRQDSVWEKTALMHAASLDKTEIVTEVIKLLLQAGADVNGQDSNGKTALMYAVFYLNAEIVKTLLQAGANVNARDNQYRTALTIAYRAHDKRGFLDNMLVKKDYKNTVQALKQAGATK